MLQEIGASSQTSQTAGPTIPVVFEPWHQYPGDYCCKVYGDPDYSYSGGVGKFCLTDAGKSESIIMDDYYLNDVMSSYWCGNRVEAWFCEDNDGDCN